MSALPRIAITPSGERAGRDGLRGAPGAGGSGRRLRRHGSTRACGCGDVVQFMSETTPDIPVTKTTVTLFLERIS